MLNHIVVMGRLTRDPELRKTPAGVSVTTFSLASDRDFSQQDGQKETDFLDVVAWRSTAELRQSILQRGAWRSCPAACKFGIGRTRRGTNAAAPKFLLITSTLATARRKMTAVPPLHLHRASVRLRSRAALCRTSAEDIKRASCLCRCFDCINFGMLVK